MLALVTAVRSAPSIPNPETLQHLTITRSVVAATPEVAFGRFLRKYRFAEGCSRHPRSARS